MAHPQASTIVAAIQDFRRTKSRPYELARPWKNFNTVAFACSCCFAAFSSEGELMAPLAEALTSGTAAAIDTMALSEDAEAADPRLPRLTPTCWAATVNQC